MIIAPFSKQVSLIYSQETKLHMLNPKMKSRSLQKLQKERKTKPLYFIIPKKNIDYL